MTAGEAVLRQQYAEANLRAAEAFMSAGYAPNDDELVRHYLAGQPHKAPPIPKNLVVVKAVAARRVAASKQASMPIDIHIGPLASFDATLRRINGIENNVRKRATGRDIARQTARRHRIPYAEIIGPVRTKNVVRARHEAFYLIRKLLGLSLPQIGRIFGDRDHTTVLHGIKKHAERNELPL